MKQVTIGNLTFSKVLCGTNAFWGRSHFSEARSAEYQGRFDDETIAQTIQRCIGFGGVEEVAESLQLIEKYF